jgi:hypothetical protein
MKYSVSLQTIAWFNARRNDQSLEISPKFQRRPVWLDRERSSLVATICSGLPFPEVYIHHDTDPDTGSERHIVVDGQQRITSILKFIDGEVSLPDTDQWQGRDFRDLSPEEKQRFWAYLIVVRSLNQTNDAEIRNLFEILNTNNFSLNDQEIRNAHYLGAFKQLAERMADNPLFQTIGLFTPRDIRRMLDVEYASELLLLTIEGVTNKKDLLDDAYASFEEELPRETEYEGDFSVAINLVHSLITSENRSQAKRKSNFYTLYGACLLYFRKTGRGTFKRANEVTEIVSRILSICTLEAAQDATQPYRLYFDAVTRAASDKGRRSKREEIMFSAITTIDDGGTPEQWEGLFPVEPLEIREAVSDE